VDRLLAGNRPPQPLHCADGCAWCCHNQVSVTPMEALHLARHLRAGITALGHEEIGTGIKELVAGIRGLGREQIYALAEKPACVFLVEGSCAVYPARPLVCRGWHSLDREDCRRAFASSAPDFGVPSYPPRLEVVYGVQEGLLTAARELGLEAGWMLLPRALSLVLDDPGAAAAWAGGGRVFAGRSW
jgi:hypothetical protein